MTTIKLLNRDNKMLYEATGECATALTVSRAYEQGDWLEIQSDAAYLYISVDAFLPPAYVYVPDGRLAYRFPTDAAALQPYAPQAFRGLLHTYTACVADEAKSVYRNLALNPAAQRAFEGGYPFAHANVETRDESVFFARNTIDGCLQNNSHGPWPFQSWGIGLSETAEIQIDFGRAVTADKMLLTLRADFPHDAYWRQATVTLSDGTELTFSLEKSEKAQTVLLGGEHQISWIKLHSLVKEVMDSPFPALTEWEIWGRG